VSVVTCKSGGFFVEYCLFTVYVGQIGTLTTAFGTKLSDAIYSTSAGILRQSLFISLSFKQIVNLNVAALTRSLHTTHSDTG
jgi:hypothetical protein